MKRIKEKLLRRHFSRKQTELVKWLGVALSEMTRSYPE